MTWRITIGGKTFDETEVTTEHILTVAEMTGRDEWAIFNPTESPRTMVAWASVALAVTTGQQVGVAAAFVRSRPINEIMATFGVAPDPDDKTETNGSEPETAMNPSVAAMLAAHHHQG
jgi:hypothetical protein